MDKEITKFGDIEVEKHKFHQYKSPNSIKNVDISKTVVSKSVSFGKKGFKFFTWYEDDNKVRPLCIMLPKMNVYRRDFDETKHISFLIKCDIYNEI